jgi:hypothetical protein
MPLPSRTRHWVALGGISIAFASGGCLFPTYTFTESGGGGMGGMTTASTSASSSSMSSSSTGMPPTEDCFDGIDNDGDGLADCDDPKCATVTECVDQIPVGWGTYNYVVIGEGDPAMPVVCPTFAPTSAFTGFSSLQSGGASCSDCGCDPPAGETCDLTTDLNGGKAGVQFAQVRDVPCGMNATHIVELTTPGPLPWTPACSDVDSAPGGLSNCPGGACNKSIVVALPSVSGGSCMANGGMLMKQMPSWQTAATACGGTHAAGCTGGKKCMPKGMAPFNFAACIGKAGDQTCPAPFTKKHTYFTDFDDSRGCSTCSCGMPLGGVCDVTLSFYGTAACSGSVVGTILAGASQCVDLTGNPAVAGRSATISVAPNGATCSPDNTSSTVTGSVVPRASTETTFCCF